MDATTTVAATGNPSPVPPQARHLEFLSGLPVDDQLPTVLDWAAGAGADRADLAIKVMARAGLDVQQTLLSARPGAGPAGRPGRGFGCRRPSGGSKWPWAPTGGST